MVVDNPMEHQTDRSIRLEDKKSKDKLILFVCVLLSISMTPFFHPRDLSFSFLQSSVSLSLYYTLYTCIYIFCSLWKENMMSSRLDPRYGRMSSP
jgi:hypothetical protein